MVDDFMRRLNDSRLNAWENAKHILERAAEEGRDLSAEEEAAFERANADVNALDERLSSLLDAEKRGADLAEAMRGIESRPVDAPAAAAAPADDLRAFLRGETRALTFKPTVAELRDLTKGTAASGGATVPTTFGGMLWAHLIETATIAGISTVLNTDSGEPMTLPVTTSHSSAALIAENATITESDPAFTTRALSAYKYAVAIQAPNELITDTGVDLEGYLAMQAGRAVGNALGAHLATGTGSSQPAGIVTGATTGVTGGTAVSGAFTADNLIDLYFSVIAPYRNSPKCGWIMKDATLAAVRKLKDTTNQYLWQPGLVAGAPDMLLGKPVYTDPNIAATALDAKSVIFGDLGAYVTRIVGGVRFEQSADFAFGTDQTTFRCIVRGDGILADQTGAVRHFVGGAS